MRQMGVRRVLLLALSAGLIGVYLFALTAYAATPAIINHVEAGIPSVSWLFALGKPIYPGPDEAERYASIYGPMLYIVNGCFMWLTGPSLLSAKAPEALAAVGVLALCFLTLRRKHGNYWGLIGAGLLASFVLQFHLYSFCLRPDPYICFCVALTVFAWELEHVWLAALLCGAALGLAANLKIYAPVFFLPVLAAPRPRRGFALAVVAGVAALVFAAPFALPNVSLRNFLYWAAVTRRQGFRSPLPAISKELLYAAPIILVALWGSILNPGWIATGLRKNWQVAAATSIALLLIIVPCSKVGSGPHMLLGFGPLYVTLMFKIVFSLDAAKLAPSRLRTSVAASGGMFMLGVCVYAICTGVATGQQSIFYNNQYAQPALADIQAIVQRHPDMRIEMGWGETHDSDYKYTFYRSPLVFHSGSLLQDASCLMDMEACGVRIAPAMLETMKSGAIGGFLIPAGMSPFTMRSSYTLPTAGPVAEASFREAFLANYEPVEHTPTFDVWLLRRPAQPRQEPDSERAR